jgi:hypothetical protein
MKQIRLNVPDGIFEITQSIAISQNRSVEDFAAEALSRNIHEAMGQNLQSRKTTTCTADLLKGVDLTLHLSSGLYRLLEESAKADEDPSVEDWVVKMLQPNLIMMAEDEGSIVDFTTEDVNQIFEGEPEW